MGSGPLGPSKPKKLTKSRGTPLGVSVSKRSSVEGGKAREGLCAKRTGSWEGESEQPRRGRSAKQVCNSRPTLKKSNWQGLLSSWLIRESRVCPPVLAIP